MNAELLAAIEDRFASELEPLLERLKTQGGYNCCGCSTYETIYEHALRIVREVCTTDAT